MSGGMNDASHLAMKPCRGCGVMMLTLKDGDPGDCGPCVQRRPDAQLWEVARLKAKQLEVEIRSSSASAGQKSDMLHTLSKLTMFAGDAVRTPL